jgi:cholesterol oxidase
MAVDYDVVVIGSGFGGAVCAFRLATAGLRVLVLERGRRWVPETYPRRLEDPWLWDATQPARLHGWFDIRRFPGMTVVQGAGVGGGSLVYANISIEARPDTFHSGWPAEISYDALEEHYRAAGTMLDVQQVPGTQWPERTRLLQEAALKSGYADRFRLLDLAVRFDPAWNYDLPDPHDARHSKRSPNAQGVTQGTCVHLGNCDIGCDVQAKNTLDLNYLAGAEARGAEIRPLHLVRLVKPAGGGYTVQYDEIVGETLTPGQVTGGIVILAAGSLGSTELLLRSREQGALPNLSPRLGRGWSSNGDFLTPALHFTRNVAPTRGPTITSAIDLLDGAFMGQDIFVEDGGLPDLGVGALQRLASDDHADCSGGQRPR